MAGADKRKVGRLPCGAGRIGILPGEVCVIGRSMNIRSAWAGLGLHLK